METIRGKQTYSLDAAALPARSFSHRHILLDIGTGDGRYVLYEARKRPDCLYI